MRLNRWVDRLILFPTRESIQQDEATRHLLPESQLEIWIHRRPQSTAQQKPKLYLLHFIGNASRAEWEHPIFLDLLAENYSVEAWVLNYPGYGGSPGDAKLKSIPWAAETAYQALLKTAGSHPILLSGNSLGTSAALYLAARNLVKGLILQNPPPIQNMILYRYGWWNLWMLAVPVATLVPRQLNSLINAPLVHAPAIFITSEHDLTVPPRYQRKIIESYRGPSRTILIPDAGHNTELPVTLYAEMKRFLEWLIHDGR